MTAPAPRRAVVLLSGGLDSATTLALAQEAGFAPHALSFAYGQKQAVELEAAARVSRLLGCVEHRVVHLDLGAFGGSALTSQTLEVPKDRDHASIGVGVPITYVPARNTVFLAYALAWAEVLGAFDIFIGANEVDYSGYPDCRPAFVEAFTALANLATAAAVEGRGQFRVHAPLMHMTKAEIVTRGTDLGVPYGETHSCYDPVTGLACGRCDACILRRQGFERAGIADPTRYAPRGPSA
ncbi:MAG TPA: 7-cyano-7-deazaguanine synthase QueC [Myxococcota bacterium]|nr:7-cyano-7-deazaguanine synthase QueC [Myxococcota bacterium]